MGKLDGKKVAILATDGFEQSELTSPRKALEHAGATVDVIAPHEGSIRGWKDKNWAESVEVTARLEVVSATDYDALMLPGGPISPDHLRANPLAVEFATAFFETRKPIAAICHAGWTLVETGHLKGRRMTSYPSIKTDLINAGAKWLDEAVVNDRGLVTSRNPDDLPMFNEMMIAVFAEGRVEAPRERPAARRKKPAAASQARAKVPARKSAKHGKPRGTKHAPRRRAPSRR